MTIRVLIADDHEFVRGALRDLLDATDDIRVVAECADGSEVVGAAAATEPDVVLMDLQMPRMTGLEATRELLAAQPGVRVLVLTGALTPGSVREARELGAVGFLFKGDDPTELPDQVRAVARGETAWGPSAVEAFRSSG